ncbi:Bug family tripartite tricarboxylate transporter substrate binding protein [Pseudorhodoplanes sp.]|uniref:Bug family tripartite tricarboxylate transporter substrate binding protein n=1 Tax=Pseudorhodoplanes sp. TaxID=1934341 RepID=UPI002CFF44C2|nr:tripartite tricarboxylate transporter substrate-binding protein [Pseudorhodoplanes sp.]HWV43248.1 tripartite tricarboxylate transporter substrate-binding protein [Pseudorhodoplanes sp.]
MIRFAAALIGAMFAFDAAIAQDYPTRPIRFLQGFAPGGNADTISRVLAEEMSKTFKAGFINEAKVGAGGNLASDAVAKSDPDGYSIVLFTTGHVISPALNKSLGFDPVEDFSFISTVSEFPFFIVVGADSRFKTIDDLVKAAREKPGTLTVGTAGVGTGQHMCSELFAVSLKSKFVHVPYRGDAGAVTALLGGNVDFIIAPGTAIFGQIEAGKFRALAVSGKQRWASLPNVPTIAESGAPGFEVLAWTGVATTKGVAKPIVDKLNTEVRRAIAVPTVSDKLKGLGSVPVSSTPEEVTEKVRSQVKLWKEVAEKAGLEKR